MIFNGVVKKSMKNLTTKYVSCFFLDYNHSYLIGITNEITLRCNMKQNINYFYL